MQLYIALSLLWWRFFGELKKVCRKSVQTAMDV